MFIEITDQSFKSSDQRCLLNTDWIKGVFPDDEGGCKVLLGDGYAVSPNEVPVEMFLAKESYDQLKAIMRVTIYQPEPSKGK
jgi:hypothetical protein